MYMFFSLYEYDLYSIASLIVSANQLAMCTCFIIAVLIHHDVIIQILPSISMWLDTHIGLIRPHFKSYSCILCTCTFTVKIWLICT